MKETPLETLDLAVFEPLVNSHFNAVISADIVVELMLSQAIPLAGPQNQNKPERSFRLVFHGPDTVFLPQRIYSLEHDSLGRISLFIVPIAKQGGVYHYEAIFNRI